MILGFWAHESPHDNMRPNQLRPYEYTTRVYDVRHDQTPRLVSSPRLASSPAACAEQPPISATRAAAPASCYFRRVLAGEQPVRTPSLSHPAPSLFASTFSFSSRSGTLSLCPKICGPVWGSVQPPMPA